MCCSKSLDSAETPQNCSPFHSQRGKLQNFGFADLLVHDIQEVKRLQVGFVDPVRLKREEKKGFCAQDFAPQTLPKTVCHPFDLNAGQLKEVS